MSVQQVYLEHSNITVTNIESSTRFFQAAFPDFIIRGGGTRNDRKWIHLGNETTYVALNETLSKEHHSKNYAKNGFNHLGFVVSDVKSLAKNLLEAGFKRDYPKQIEKFRIRDYFLDEDGNEFEFIQYLSDKLEERNFYD
ncbi:MAG: putative lactoylglutathione lyase [Flavobacteriaceae bacterium]|jgi:predicted lactoylglutathione lyase